jgi:hypothetical protein
MIYRGHVKDGVVVLDEATPLPEGQAVVISPVEIPLDIEGQPIHPAFLIGDLAVEAEATPEDADNPLLRMLDLAGPTGIPDLATNHDHYLYGHPKVDDEG